MKKINIDKSSLISMGVMIGTGLLGLLKIVDDKNKKAAEKEEMIGEIMDRLSKND